MAGIIQKKICMLGDFSTGKTSLVKRYIYDIFDDRYLSSIGVKISRKEVIVSPDLTTRLFIWDMAGGEKFSNTAITNLQGSAGALLVGDLTRTDTISHLYYHYQLLQEYSPGAAAVLIGNKSDLVSSNADCLNIIKKKAEEIQVSLSITSAKNGKGVEEAFYLLVKAIIENNGNRTS